MQPEVVGYYPDMRFTLKVEEETDGRWIVEIPELLGTLSYGASQAEAIAKAKALALRVLADQLEHGAAEGSPDFVFSSHDNEEIGPRMLCEDRKAHRFDAG